MCKQALLAAEKERSAGLEVAAATSAAAAAATTAPAAAVSTSAAAPKARTATPRTPLPTKVFHPPPGVTKAKPLLAKKPASAPG